LETYRKILQQYWGYTSFRPLQEEIIRAVGTGLDTLALMPTGGGKSITFQVPALALPGLCLVVTPLISLMTDQVERLRKNGIKAIAIHSGLSTYEVDIELDNCIYGDIKLLYLSPERLKSELFLARVVQMKINLIAVDEAHCISQWGYDFRPSYLEIAKIREKLPGVPVLALTATATAEVATDIMNKLLFAKPHVISQSFERKNLAYIVRSTEDKAAYMLQILSGQKGSAVVYVRSRKKTQELSTFLNAQGVLADFYHAGLDPKSRRLKQEAWMAGKIRVIVATNAFGMGIDKEDVRVVIHHDLPDSPEAYFQEAGRAGRDGRKAYAVLLYHPSDKQSLVQGQVVRFPEIKTILSVYQALGNYFQIIPGAGKGSAFDFDLMDFCTKFKFHSVVAYHAIKHLERSGFLELTDEIELPSRIYFRVGRDDLYKFQVAHDKYDGLIKLMLRAYTGMFTEFVKIDEQALAKKAGVKTDLLVQVLENMQRLGVIYYLKPLHTPRLIWIAERLPEKSVFFPAEDYQKRKNSAQSRVDFMLGYASSTHRCRSQLLLRYFGEKDPYRCRMCDVCLNKHASGLNQYEYDMIVESLMTQLTSGPVPMEVVSKSPQFAADKVARVVNHLIDNNIVILTGGGLSLVKPEKN